MSNPELSPNAPLNYMTIDSLFYWIRDRDPEVLQASTDYPISDEYLEALENYLARKDVSKSKSLEALIDLLAALESGRIKASGRLRWAGTPRRLPAHLWPYLTFANRRERSNGNTHTCACFRDNPRGEGLKDDLFWSVSVSSERWVDAINKFWSDLRFDRKRVLTVWPPFPGEQLHHDNREAKTVSPHRSGQARVLSPPPESIIHEAINQVYSEYEASRLKPPNVKEIIAPVQRLLREKNYEASGHRIQELAQMDQHKKRRRKPGATLASERHKTR